jgi:hypothetical protein
MIRRLLPLLAALLTTATLHAQTPPPAPPPPELKPAPAEATVDAILDRHLESIGTASARAAQRSLRIELAMELKAQNLRSQITIAAERPQRIHVRQVIPNIITMTRGYDGERGWSQDPMMGLRDLEGQELADLQLEATFDYMSDFRRHFPKRELLGIATLAGGPAYAIRLTPEQASVRTVYLDVATHRLVRQDSREVQPMGEMDLVTTFSDFRTADGITGPWAMAQQTPLGAVTLTVVKMESNVTFDPTLFQKPAPPVAPQPAPQPR